MDVTGIVVGLLDAPQAHTHDFNRWYDFDHLAEYAALPGMLQGQRYVAPPEYKAIRRETSLPELADGRGSYFSTYLVGDDDLDAVQKRWAALTEDLRRRKRLFRHCSVADLGFYRHDLTLLREDIPVGLNAVPYLGHTGVMVVLTEVADARARADVEHWYREVHGADLLGVSGVIAAMRFSRVDRAPGRYMNLYLLEGDPPRTELDLVARIPGWLENGRLPSPGEASQSLFRSVYRRVAPMEYDFRVEASP